MPEEKTSEQIMISEVMKLIRSRNTEKQQAASRENGKKGGRPKKQKEEEAHNITIPTD